MFIISKYLTREIFKSFGIVLITVIGIYIVVEFFEKADNFIEAKLSFSQIIAFFLFKTPLIFSQIMPVALLLAVLIVFGLLKKNNELTALKSSGVSPMYLLKPVLIIAMGASVFLFFFLDMVVPVTVEQSNKIWIKDVKQKKLIRTKEKNIWMKGTHHITHIQFYKPVHRTIHGITINYVDDRFNLIKKIDAWTGEFKEGKWHLYDLMEQNFDPKTGETRVSFLTHLEAQLDFLPEDFQEVIKKPEEMRFKELYEYIQRIESEGYGAKSYWVDLFAKTAFPVVCFILCLVGAGISLIGKSRDALVSGIAYGLGTAFLYWIFYSFCLSLGYGEMLPPAIAAWATNIIFLCAGTLLILYAK